MFEHTNLTSTTSIVGTIVLASILSTTGSKVCTSAEVLFTLKVSNSTPGVFSQIGSHKVPIFTLLKAAFINLLAFLTDVFKAEVCAFLMGSDNLSKFVT